MGINPMKSCFTNTAVRSPDIFNWKLLQKAVFGFGYALKVKYKDCDNFEGIKILVYEGKYKLLDGLADPLDPHFSNVGISPIARFRPDGRGWSLAVELAKSL